MSVPALSVKSLCPVSPADRMCPCLLSATITLYAYGISVEKPVVGRLQTIWFDWKHGKSHVGPGIQSHIISDTQPSHKPTSLILKPFYFVVNVPPIATNPPLHRSHPSPISPRVRKQGWVWVQAQLASSSWNVSCSGECTGMNWVPDQSQTDITQNNAAYWYAVLPSAFFLDLLLIWEFKDCTWILGLNRSTFLKRKAS